MTVSQRKPVQSDEVQTVNEPGEQCHCNACACDLTHTIRMVCADPVCVDSEEGVDLCPPCFCAGKEFGLHKRGHAYRVVEFNSYPIFTEDWGADEELLLLKGIVAHGIGNWYKVAEHVGTRTKEEVEQHYNQVYVDSPNWPLPNMDAEFNVNPSEFQERKRRRISQMNALAPPEPKIAPVSAPAMHEIATFLPGRLEFEHELDNEAEDLVKDLEFGVVLQYGGDAIIEDEHDQDVKARIKWEEERMLTPAMTGMKRNYEGKGIVNGSKTNGNHVNGRSHSPAKLKAENEDSTRTNGKKDDADGEDDEEPEEPHQPPPIETDDSLAFKLTTMEMYAQRIEKRDENKAVMFDRGLLDYKKMQAIEKKRPKEEKEILNRLRPFARLQTAEDYETFSTDILYEAMLRKRIAELQTFRRLGLQNAADIEKYEADLVKRTQAKASRDYYVSQPKGRQSQGPDARKSHDREESAPRAPGSAPHVRKMPAPLNIANSPSLHLLTPGEQTLCSQLRILPKPYLVIKETIVREYARRGGKLRRREARDLVKIDVNKTSRVWDFLFSAGYLNLTQEQPVQPRPGGMEPSASTGSIAGSSSSLPNGTTPPTPTHPGRIISSVTPQPSPSRMPSITMASPRPP